MNYVDPKGLFAQTPKLTLDTSGGGSPPGDNDGPGIDADTDLELVEEEPGPGIILSEECAAGLKSSGQTAAAIERASNAGDILKSVADKYHLDWRLLAAIGIRESGFQNLAEIGGGPGRGVFQLTENVRAGITAQKAGELEFAATFTARQINTGLSMYSAVLQEYAGINTNALAARIHNTGPWNKYTFAKLTSGDDYINQLDRGTAHGNYVTSVLNLMHCF